MIKFIIFLLGLILGGTISFFATAFIISAKSSQNDYETFEADYFASRIIKIKDIITRKESKEIDSEVAISDIKSVLTPFFK